MRTRINITNLVATFVLSATLGSCSNEQPKSPKEKYESIISEISKEPSVFEDTREMSEKDEKLVKSALEEALRSNDFDYANKYCDLLKRINYSESERYNEKIKAKETTILKESMEEALKRKDFDSAKKYCSEFEAVRYTESLEYSDKIKAAETNYLATVNTEDAANRLIASIDTRPTQKPKIGRESESAPAYEWQSKRHNKCIDEYLDKALAQKNDILAQKLLSQYVEELTFKTITKVSEKGIEYKHNVVTGFSDNHKIEATKRYENAKKSW